MRTERVQLRIVSGTLRGRRITCSVDGNLRPTPQKVREALFNILGNAVPGRPFIDIFSGTGIFGLEALSRGASFATFVERDFKLSQNIDSRLAEYHLQERSQVLRTDAYRWVSYWHVSEEPINVFLSPPFRDLKTRSDDFVKLVDLLREKIPDRSVLTVQSEGEILEGRFTDQDQWDTRHYGRNFLMVWVKEPVIEVAETR